MPPSSSTSSSNLSTRSSSIDIAAEIRQDNNDDEEKAAHRRDPDAASQSSFAAAIEAKCWISIVNGRKARSCDGIDGHDGRQKGLEESDKDVSMDANGKVSRNPLGAVYSSVGRRIRGAVNSNSNNNSSSSNGNSKPKSASRCCSGGLCGRAAAVLKWVVDDFMLRHLVWIKLIFLFQSASMTVLYPYLNLHMKSLGLTVLEAAAINAVVPILFIFTPPIAGFLADRLGNFRFLLSLLTALGGLVALLLLAIPPGRHLSPYPDTLTWGLACGRPDNRARFQKLMLRGFRRDECRVRDDVDADRPLDLSLRPGTCGYLCPTRTRVERLPHFYEYRVIWPNRGGGFGISEIVDVVTLDSPDARRYHEPGLVDDDGVFFPMNWTFHLSCDRIRPNDCIFNPIRRAPADTTYEVQASPITLSPSPSSRRNNRKNVNENADATSSPSAPLFDVSSITPPETGRAVSVPVNCGAKELVANVVSTVMTASLPPGSAARAAGTDTVDTRFSGCTLHCMVDIPRGQVCANGSSGVTYSPVLTFWLYLLSRTSLGVLTAASLMMFEGAVMATIQESGGDYGIQRFVGNFGAIVFAPLGGFLIDATSEGLDRPDFSAAVYIYLALKLAAAAMILCVKLDFRPPGERILQHLGLVARNPEVLMFLGQMMFAGSFWGFIEAFLFWFLDDLGASKLLMGWTVAIGMVTSLPFLVFSGPITDCVGHIPVMCVGMAAYAARMIGYSLLPDDQPYLVFPFEALEGLTMALMMTTAVTYVSRVASPPKTLPSVMGLMGALFFGVGKATGAIVGGGIMHVAGARIAFRTLSTVALACALAYLVFECGFARPRRKKRAEGQHRSKRDQVDSRQGEEEEVEEKGGEVNKAYEDVIPRETVSSPAKPPSSSTDSLSSAVPRPSPPGRSTSAAGSTISSNYNAAPPSIASSSGPRSLTGGTRV